MIVERDLNDTQGRLASISDSLEVIGLNLTATLQLLEEATRTANDTFLSAQQLNASEADLFNTFTSIRAALVSSQQQIYNLSDKLMSVSVNANEVAMTSNDAAMTINQTIHHIRMAVETLYHLEASLLPMLQNVTALVDEQTDNGTELHRELLTQLGLVMSQADQLFNSSWRSLNIVNSTVKSLMNISTLQQNVSARTLAQMAVSQRITNELDSLSNDLTVFQGNIRFYTNYIITEESNTFSLVSMDQINQTLQEAIQLITAARSLLGNVSMLTALRTRLYTTLSSFEASYNLLPDQVQTLQEEAFRLHNYSISLHQNATTASQEANMLVEEAQNLQMVLRNFSGFVESTSELLQSIEAIQISAIGAINTANNISDMITEAYRVVNESLLSLMESSDSAQVIEMVSVIHLR